MRRSGFTLMELLVVVGVIALLLSVLLPTLSRSREAAARTACLSNLRQIHQILSMYAAENRQYVPVGYRDGTPAGIKQFNSMVYSGTSRQLVLWGVLWEAGWFPSPAVLFCPAESDPSRQMGTEVNPWPPPLPPTTSTRNIQAGYGGRPGWAIPDDRSLWTAANLPRLGDFAGKAMVADLVAVPARVESRHRRGVNVVYGDGSARWVERGVFDSPLSQCAGLSAAFNPQQDAIWAALDRP
ncbi:MAG: type II secretion system protein [Tepidisphaerales bacterium]